MSEEAVSSQQQGMHYLFDFQYELSEKSFLKVIMQNKYHPAGYFGLALIEASRIYEDGFDTEAENRMKQYLNLALSAGRQAYESIKPSTTALLFYGLSLGLSMRNLWHDKQYLEIYSTGMLSLKVLKMATETDSTCYDAYIAQGLYDYLVTLAPFNLKPVLAFFQIQGNRESGLKQLQLVAEKAIFIQSGVQLILFGIYSYFEKDYPLSEKIILSLLKEYPNNLGIIHSQAYLYIHYGQWAKLEEVFKNYQDKILSLQGQRKQLWQYKLHYMQGRSFYARKEFDKALPYFIQTIQYMGNRSPEDYFASWALLRAGMIWDMKGQHSKAIKYYQFAAQSTASTKVQILADEYLQKPYELGDTRMNQTGAELIIP